MPDRTGERLLDGRVAVVTGASRGIGRSIAGALAAEGAHVVLAARSASQLEETAGEITGRGLRASFHPTDVSDPLQVEDLAQWTIGTLGTVDILVNNAGIGVFRRVVDMQVSEFDQMWNVNMRGAFLATRAVLPEMMKAHSGNIVNICSLAGKNAVKEGAGYAATKWALRGFASSLMLEVRRFNIRVVTIFPGSVATGFSSPDARAQWMSVPEDVASAVVFAVSTPARTMYSEIDLRPTNPE